jgi:hypothetical protein
MTSPTIPAVRHTITVNAGAQRAFEPDPARASEIEITFTVEGPERTRVTLDHHNFDHHNFERHGPDGEQMRRALGAEGGWGDILATYAKTVTS